MNSKRLHTIKSVSEITGLSVFVIRAWENRYKAVEPERTETNRRLYSEEDINKLLLLSKAISAGYSIGNIANLSIEELNEITSQENRPGDLRQSSTDTPPTPDSEFMDQCLAALQEMNAAKFDSLLLKASVELSNQALLDKLIVPLIHTVGEMWKQGTLRIASEHMFSNSIKIFLANLVKSYRIPENSPKIIVSTPAGQQHELGALLAACIAASSGWNVIYLGPDLPVEEIASAANKLKVKAVTLSLVYPVDDVQLMKDLKRLRKIMPRIPILIGGRAAMSYHSVLESIDAKVGNSLIEFRDKLDEIRKPLSN
jgi:DNA-binding transcriptional MerR regulator/methylmalonyl-CoA mutase cobalamin-binding subunit